MKGTLNALDRILRNIKHLQNFNYPECNKNYEKELRKRFANTNKFWNGDSNMFCLMLRKGVYPLKYTDSWQ